MALGMKVQLLHEEKKVTKENTMPRRRKGAKWWHALDTSVVDPITLEAVCELRVEPFCLNESFYFDGEALAVYLVASGNYENPLNRQALSDTECRSLDAHLARNHLRRMNVAQERKAKENNSDNRESRLTAEAILVSMFGSTRRRVEGVRSESLRGGLERALQVSAPRPTEVITRPSPATNLSRPQQFPALSRQQQSRSNNIDWSETIRKTRASDERRHSLRLEDQAAAEAAVMSALLAKTERIIARTASAQQFMICNELRTKRGSFIFLREKKEEALALWSEATLLSLGRRLREQKRLFQIEQIIHGLIHDPAHNACRDLPAQRNSQDRKATHALAEFYGLDSISLDFGPHRHVRIMKKKNHSPTLPSMRLNDAITYIDAYNQVLAKSRRRGIQFIDATRQRQSSSIVVGHLSDTIKIASPVVGLPISPSSVRQQHVSSVVSAAKQKYMSTLSTTSVASNQDFSPAQNVQEEDPLLQEAIRRSLAEVWTAV